MLALSQVLNAQALHTSEVFFYFSPLVCLPRLVSFQGLALGLASAHSLLS